MISRRGLLQKVSSLAPVAAAGAVLGRVGLSPITVAEEEQIPEDLPSFYNVNIKDGVFQEMRSYTLSDGSVEWERTVLGNVSKVYTEFQGRIVKLEFVK